ncbi:alanine--tRNA ligase [Acidianus brierleyi]|uniref:Alanine--tRNA ligase n=1 Tax=Acidianus brierleyi TaxID=41673 RepID=A0A2U9IFU1_9CREN|nr:alanine--tRNA ligase [Acidianus brierleyi]AWR94917.1 alanine--tRNA ligase [Acidianus brierleyi]
MIVDEKEYKVRLFNNNYYRKTCNVCKTPFWTKDKERTNCADIPCSDYYFLDLDVSKLNLSVKEARSKFLNFFKRHDHEIIPPKPVLARWREDLYLTIASIVDFQPQVTSGLVPPPANPLVISQPCIRLEDIDNVGITFGRHLTTFEMGGHHAFNYPDKYIYWKDETVELSKEFFTEELGIPEELLTFKESWWEGGGNAGPSFEVTVGGLELATLVFMQYEIKGSDYIPLKLKIVDTGYGIERLAWFTQKTPTAFHAIYGNLVYTFFKKLNQAPVDEEMLKTAARLAGRIDTDHPESIKLHREEVAKKIGEKLEYVDSELTRAARVFQVLDHTKTIALMLADGLVPSNSGEGYLGRLLIRRTLRTMKLLGANADLVDLISEQINYWKEDFPEMLKNKDYILDAIENEEQKFNETISKIPSIVNNLSKKKNITAEDLAQVYDSNGVPPELLTEELKKKGIELQIPFNFYALVAKRHQTAPIKSEKEKSRLTKDVIDFASKFEPTKKLYYTNQYLREFDGNVIGVYKNFIITDQTVFYPEGGGQLGDKGFIITSTGEKYSVIDTQKVSDVILHILDREAKINVGEKVHGEIDWQRRYRLMKHHTATHVILAAAKKLLGDHIWQAGAEKTPEKARLDITHYKMLSKEEIRKIEDMANFVINDRRPVNAFEMNRTEAETKFGVSIYEGGVPNKASIRLLEIKDWDVESCGGTHVSNTSEIGAIKIVNVEKIQDGVIRLEYVAGDMVTNYAREIEDEIDKTSEILGVDRSQLEIRSQRFIEDKKKVDELLNEYRKWYIEYLLENSSKEIYNGVNILILKNIIDQEIVKEIMKRFTIDSSKVVVNIYNNNQKWIIEIATSSNIKVDPILDNLRKIGGKGGGKGTYCNVSFVTVKEDDIINAIKQGLKGSL